MLHPRKLLARGKKIEEGCLRTVRCLSMEPADTNNPITTHTPPRPQAQHHQTNHTPQALFMACEHMEASGGAAPASLGMTDRT